MLLLPSKIGARFASEQGDNLWGARPLRWAGAFCSCVCPPEGGSYKKVQYAGFRAAP